MQAKPTPLLIRSALTSSLSVFQFGYHTGVLNNPKTVFTECHKIERFPLSRITLTEFQFSLLTSLLPLFGILGTLLGGRLIEKGRKYGLQWSGSLFILSSLCLLCATSPFLFMMGRAIAGIASGISLVINPAYLGEIAPISLKGPIGMINQLSIVLGIVVSQLMGLFFSSEWWRILFVLPLLLNLLMCWLFFNCPESPQYLLKKADGFKEAEETLKLLRNTQEIEDELILETHEESKSLWFILNSHYYFPSLMLVFFAQLTQQLSGINGIMYYSTDILQANFGTLAPQITVLVNVFQFIGTLIASRLVEKKGRKTLLLSSSILMSLFLLVLALALNQDKTRLAAMSLFASIIAFAIGLGPIPFLFNAELSDGKSIGVNSTVATITNLGFNFLIALVFKPLTLFFGGGIFLLFSGWLLFASFLFFCLVPETKQKSAVLNIENLNENWKTFRLN